MSKGKKIGGDVGDIELESDTWNVAVGFSNLKILKILVELDKYEKLSRFGTEEMGEDINYNENEIRKKRVEGLFRFHFGLQQLISNTYFAIRRGRQQLDNYDKRLEQIEDFIDKCYNSDEDMVTHEELFEINEEHFRKILKILREIKKEMNILLNDASLIFRQSDEVDLDKIMQDIVQGG